MSEKIIITSAHETPTTTSLNVAKVFDKRHDHVIRDIENLISSKLRNETDNNSQIDSPNLGALKNWFFESTYINSRGKVYKCYEMTKDGFVLLAMGFTGEKALALKITYIEQFNAMEKELKNQEKLPYNNNGFFSCENVFINNSIINGFPLKNPSFQTYNERSEGKMNNPTSNELFELILNAKNLTEEKIKTLKRILIDTNPYNADGTGKLNPVNLEKYLKEKNITIRYDDILHDLEIKGYDSSKIYTKDLFLNDCRYELEKYLKLCTPERLSGSLTSIAMKSHYNPILELIDNAEYNGKDCLQTAYEVLGIDDSAEYDDIRRSNNRISREILKTWLKQAYCMLHNGFCGEIFGLDFVLVLQGRQGKGKTSFFRKLALKREYFGEGMTLNVDDKDSLIKAVTKFIAELGEIESTFKRDKDKLKAFITNETDEYRKPYGQTYMTYPRLTSLCGTVNSVEFLTDDTGNRRYGVIPIDDSHDIIKHLDRLDPLQLWAQIREIVNNDLKNGKTYANCFRDRDLQVAVNARNTRFQKPIKGELEIKEIIESERAVADGDTRHKTEEVYMSASQFKDVHGDKTGNLSLPQIRAVFERLGIPQETGIKRTYDNTPLKNTYKVPYKRLI